jgi:hypothetical protein
MRYNLSGSLKFLAGTVLLAVTPIAIIGYFRLAGAVTVYVGHYFNLPENDYSPLGFAIFFIVPMTALAGFVLE